MVAWCSWAHLSLSRGHARAVELGLVQSGQYAGCHGEIIEFLGIGPKWVGTDILAVSMMNWHFAVESRLADCG